MGEEVRKRRLSKKRNGERLMKGWKKGRMGVFVWVKGGKREGKGMGVWVSEGRGKVKWMRAIECVVWMRRREREENG